MHVCLLISLPCRWNLHVQCMLTHICYAYTCIFISMYAYTFTARLHIEMGPTQTSEGKERFPAS